MNAVDADVAAVAALFGDPARAAMLTALVGGVALPAGQLAQVAGVSAATATAHLRRLLDGGLVVVLPQGRHRYYRLADERVAETLEQLARLAPAVPVRSLKQSRTAAAMAEARTCYGHLAGRLGVELRDRLVGRGAFRMGDNGIHQLTGSGAALLESLGIDPAALPRRRVLAKDCLDWTQRRPHLAGSAANAVTDRMIELGWLARRADGRALSPAPDFAASFDGWLPPVVE